MRLLVAFLLLALAVPASAQSQPAPPYTLELVEVEIASMPALHSFAWAERDGKWLFVAGRTDGLHGVIETGAFPAEESNDAVWVVDPAADQVWSQELDGLGAEIRDALSATNPQYHQDGETLYVVGGYGTDSATGQKITFPTLTALDVPAVVEAVTTGADLAPHIRQTTDDRLAVTGGELRGGDGCCTLFGGQRFDGEYAVTGTGFTQAYTERIALFSVVDDGALAISNPFYLDEDLGYDPEVLHRRDMTVAPSYYRYLPVDAENPDDTAIAEGYKLYGGVFLPDVNLPHRTQLQLGFSDIPEVRESGYEQQFAHYTAPALPLWDAQTETMHTTFFGGMAQFVYDEANDAIVEDLLIPFTDDIVTFSDDISEESPATYETVMPVQMPGLLGTNAVMIPAAALPRSDLGIVHLREVAGRTLMGHIVGGIASTMPNAGWSGMTAAATSASDRVFAVYLTPAFSTASEPVAGPAELAFEGPYPNPFRSEATVAFTLDRAADLTVEVFDVLGRRVVALHDGPLGAQHHTFTFRPGSLPSGVYTVVVRGDGVHATRSVVRVR